MPYITSAGPDGPDESQPGRLSDSGSREPPMAPCREAQRAAVDAIGRGNVARLFTFARSGTMKNIRLCSALTVVASVLVAAACSSDNLTEPSAAPSLSVGAWSPSLAICRTRSDSSVTKEIGWKGGSLSVNGNTLVIPRYALSSPVTITMSQQKGINSEVELQPEGLQFVIPAT